MRDIRRVAVTELFGIFKITLTEIFSILKLRRNVCLNFWKFTCQEKTNLSSGKSELQMFFFLFQAAMFVSLRRAPTWHLHTNLYKFVWNIMSNNSSTEYCTDLRLGQSPYLFIVYNVPISWLHSVDGFQFLFWWCDSENRQYYGFSVVSAWKWVWYWFYCAVPEKIHTYPMEGHQKFQGGGGLKSQNLVGGGCKTMDIFWNCTLVDKSENQNMEKYLISGWKYGWRD